MSSGVFTPEAGRRYDMLLQYSDICSLIYNKHHILVRVVVELEIIQGIRLKYPIEQSIVSTVHTPRAI